MIGAIFENRDFTPYPRKHWDELIVEKYAKAVLWGPKTARLRAHGSEAELFEFFEMLRCPVYLVDQTRAKNVWWGYIGKVTIATLEGLTISIDIDTMNNKIALAYTYNKERATSSFASDTTSQAEYGIKEKIITAHEQTEAQVNSYRDNLLESMKYPTASAPRWNEPGGEAVAIIECRGWGDTLDWRYYANEQGRVEYVQMDGKGREIGEDDRPIAAMSFQQKSGSAWTASEIWLRVRKYGTPTDNLVVALYSSSGGDPNASLTGTDDIAGADVNDRYEWTKFTLDTPQALADSTEYWIHVSRSGAISTSNFFAIGGTALDGYGDGNGKIQRSSDSSWYVWGSCPDFNFRVLGEAETTAQITTALTSVGEFIEGVDVADTSGVNSSPFRDGDATALYEIEKLLKVGTTNNRRLLATMSALRRVRIYEEPAPWSADWKMNQKRVIRDSEENIINPADCPVGYWARLTGIYPDTVDASRLINVSHTFIETAEYNAIKNEYLPLRTKEARSALDSITISEG